VLWLPARLAPDFPYQVAVILRDESTVPDGPVVSRNADAVPGRATLPATIEGHAVQLYVAPPASRRGPATIEGHAVQLYVAPASEQAWASEQLPHRGIVIEMGDARLQPEQAGGASQQGETDGR
jgi:hypothetical protein